MKLCAPWDDYKNKQFFADTFSQHLHTQIQTWITWVNSLKTINELMVTCAITKTGTLATTFHKPEKEANPYVPFGFCTLTICNHTRVQVSVPMNSYPINMIHTSQQSTKDGLKE